MYIYYELPSLSWYISIWINGDETELLVQVEQIDWLYNVACFILKSVSEPSFGKIAHTFGFLKREIQDN